MIGRLRGILLEKQPPFLIVDVGGVGYELQAPMNTFYKLPELGQEVVLQTQFIVREDSQQLYGFIDKTERSLFRSLLKVNGVGAKLALAILSSMEPDRFVRCIIEHDTAALVKLPGIGKKTAERLVIEMCDRLQDWDNEMSFSLPEQTRIDSVLVAHSPHSEAISALISLGYKPQEASKVINKINITGLSSEEIIRQALKNI